MAPTRDVQPLNMKDEEVTLSVVNKSEAYMVTRPEQFSNILLISVTLAVLKFDRSREVRPEQLKNIENIFVTWAVLKLERFSEVRPEQ